MERDNSISWIFPDEDTEHHSKGWRERPEDPLGFRFEDQDYLRIFLDSEKETKIADINYVEDVGYEGMIGPFRGIWSADQSGGMSGSQNGYTFIMETLESSSEAYLIDNNEMSKDYGGEATVEKARESKTVADEYDDINILMSLEPHTGEIWINGDSKDELNFEHP